jgi:menaquinone-dependent protoporphyrinogen oxidase
MSIFKEVWRIVMINILVTYASKHQSTAEIANTIGKVLKGFSSFQVTVQPVEAVEDVTPYDAVVLGSSVYVGQWQSSAAYFLRNHQQKLAERQVWLFSSGPTGEGDPNTLVKGWEFPESLRPVADAIKPHDIALFHGKLDPDTLNFMERSAVRLVKAPTGDFRDWNAIRAWAAGIAGVLQSSRTDLALRPTT